jgi:hypothetical protein
MLPGDESVDRSDQMMSNHAPDRILVSFEGATHAVAATDALTFGRHGDVVIDPANRMLHRLLGRFTNADGSWWLSNLGSSIALVVSDLDGASFARVVPGGSIPLPFERSAVAFSAGRANYRLTVEQLGWNPRSVVTGATESTEPTVTASSLVFNDEQYALLAALARHRSTGAPGQPMVSRRQLAQELGWSDAKLGRKLDHLCTKLARAGVPGLVGRAGRTADNRRQLLADAAVELGLVCREQP